MFLRSELNGDKIMMLDIGPQGDYVFSLSLEDQVEFE